MDNNSFTSKHFEKESNNTIAAQNLTAHPKIPKLRIRLGRDIPAGDRCQSVNDEEIIFRHPKSEYDEEKFYQKSVKSHKTVEKFNTSSTLSFQTNFPPAVGGSKNPKHLKSCFSSDVQFSSSSGFFFSGSCIYQYKFDLNLMHFFKILQTMKQIVNCEHKQIQF